MSQLPVPILRIENLSVAITPKHGRPIEIIDQIDLSVNTGERLAIVGESGSGKTVTAMAIMQLIDGASYRGKIEFNNENILIKSEKELNEIRGQKIAMTFQDSLSTLNPIMRIGEQITEVLTIRGIKKSIAKSKTLTLLAELGFKTPVDVFDQYPHQLSGGMRQRVMIAIALIAEPQILIADEPTTALDVGIQAQVMRMINLLATKKNLTVILISHDLGVVAGFADIVLVMYGGKIVERGNADDIFLRARHPYTKALLNSIPTVMRDRSILLPTIDGVTIDPTNRPVGCIFQDRCPVVQSLCKVETPKEISEGANHRYSCFFPNLEDVA
jgi:oligopeptide/dipeptide ABC transporter ATP-binding protein